jgi:hypothetical protein
MAQLFLELPGELLIQILSQLTLGELLSCKCVNRLLNEIVEESVVLQYVIETEAAGVRDNPRSHLATAERLDRLRRREDAMTRFRISHIRTVPVQIPTSGIYDLSGGVYLLGTAAPHDRSVTTGINCLRFQTIAETPEWSEIKIGFEKTGRRIIDIGLALQEHDLIALVTSSCVSCIQGFPFPFFLTCFSDLGPKLLTEI